MVRGPSGLNVNSDVFVPFHGFTKSTRILICSSGLLSTSVMRPSPTSSLPAQWKMAPSPEDGPSNVALALGSSLAHGDQASQLWKSLTSANTAAGGATTIVERSMRNVDG